MASKRTIIISAICTALCLFLFTLPFEGLEPQGKNILILFVWTILMWVFRPIPEYLSGIIALVIAALVFKYTNVYSGFGSSTYTMPLFASIMGGMVIKTGLGTRLAYWLLLKFGTTPLRSMFATNLTCDILASVIASNTARATIVQPICEAVCEAQGYEAGEDKPHGADTGIVLSNLFSNTVNTFLFYTGTNSNAGMMELIIAATGMGITWMGWLKASFIPALAVLIAIPFVCNKLYPPAKEHQELKREVIQQKYDELGSMTIGEKKTIAVFILTLLLWSTEGIHGLSVTYTIMIPGLLLLLPKIGVCKFKEINDYMPWTSLLFLAGAVALASAVKNTGGFQWLVDNYIVNNAFITSLSFDQFVFLWVPLVLLSHIVFAGMAAMFSVLIPVALTMAPALGFDPYTVGLITAFSISAGAFFLPFNSTPNMMFYGTGRFTVAQQFKTSLIFFAMLLVGFIFLIKIWWPLIGIM